MLEKEGFSSRNEKRNNHVPHQYAFLHEREEHEKGLHAKTVGLCSLNVCIGRPTKFPSTSVLETSWHIPYSLVFVSALCFFMLFFCHVHLRWFFFVPFALAGRYDK